MVQQQLQQGTRKEVVTEIRDLLCGSYPHERKRETCGQRCDEDITSKEN